MGVEKEPPLRISITGVDGSGKTSAIDAVASELGGRERISRIFRPAYSIVEGEKRFHFQRLLRLVDRLHSTADEKADQRLVMATNAFHVLLQGRVIEPTIRKQIKPTLVMGARDFHIDPAVYAIFYSPSLRRKSMKDRLKRLQRITGQEYRDVIFFLTVPPEIAIERIEQRIQTDTQSEEKPHGKWRHMHEQPEHLMLLQNEYYSALDIVSRQSPRTKIIEIDTSAYSQQQVAQSISSDILSFLPKIRGIEASNIPVYQNLSLEPDF